MNLDKLFEVSQLKMAAQVEPVELMSLGEKALKKSGSHEAIAGPSSGETPFDNEAGSDSQRSRRMVKIPRKLSNYDVNNNPSGHCPGCRGFVNEIGVVCEQCRAYWHYECANVTQEQIDTIWKGDFLCETHRKSSNMSLITNISTQQIADDYAE